MKHFWKKQVPAFLLAFVLVASLLPAASAKSADIVYEVEPGKTVEFSRYDFRNLYREVKKDDTLDIESVFFDAGKAYDTSDSGTLYHDKEVFATNRDLMDTEFFYSGDGYRIDHLNFVSDAKAKDTVSMEFEIYGDAGRLNGTLEIRLKGTGSRPNSGSKADITYKVASGKDVTFDRADFRDYYESNCRGDFEYVRFFADRSYDGSLGSLYYALGDRDLEEKFTRTDLSRTDFYYFGDRTGKTYEINELSFEAEPKADGTLKLEFTVYGTRDEWDGTLIIEVGGGSSSSSKGDINYTVAPGKEVSFNPDDFNDYFQQTYRREDVAYVAFTGSEGLTSTNGSVYYRYGSSRSEVEFSRTDLEKYDFYYLDPKDGDYDLYDLSFVASSKFTGPVTLSFRAYYSSSHYVDGTVVIKSTEAEEKDPVLTDSADIRYYVGPSGSLQINPNDIARFFSSKFPGSTLEYIQLDGVPSAGYLFYDFFGTSNYGESQMQLKSSNYDDQYFYFSPESKKDFALSDLSYVPYGVNYCVTIPFTAYGSGRRSASGNIFISVTLQPVSEVYGPTPKNAPVTFPATALGKAVSSATGTSMASIRLLALPDPSVGVITAGSGGVSLKADTKTRYGLSSGTWLISQLRFTPAKNYTGPVEIPYAAYDGKGNQFAAGKLCLGIVNKLRTFKDITSTTWCYKYVTELADAGIIDGYKDGTFKEKKPLTYGAALKLVMLAAGYSEQAPTVKGSVFSGYMSKALEDHLIPGKVNLTSPISRQQVAQLAAKALKLDIRNLSSVKPFTDTNDPYVQALNAAGIVNGYFNNGTSTFKPNDSLTRGHISAIVWRMNQYRK